MAGVVADHQRPVCIAVREPGDQARGGAPDDGDVHPVRPGPHRPAQSRGAEGQRTREPVGEVGGGAGQPFDDRGQLGPAHRVRVVGKPPLGIGTQRVHGRILPAGPVDCARRGGRHTNWKERTISS
jgi:hypothetical protein